MLVKKRVQQIGFSAPPNAGNDFDQPIVFFFGSAYPDKNLCEFPSENLLKKRFLQLEAIFSSIVPIAYQKINASTSFLTKNRAKLAVNRGK